MAQAFDLEGLLDVVQEIDEDQVKEYQDLVKKTKMFVNVSVKTGSSTEAVTAGMALLKTVDGIYKEGKSRAFATTMKKTLAELRAISTQLTQQDLEKSWKCIERVMKNIKSCLPQGIQDIRRESQNDPTRGIESLMTKLQDIQKEYIAEQIRWQSKTTFTILNQFSTAKEEYKETLQQVADTLTDVEKKVNKLSDEFNQRGTTMLEKAKSLLQANKDSVSARRSEHIVGSVTSAVTTYRSISECVLAASVGVNPLYKALAVASASLAGASTLVHGTMAYKCHTAIAEADVLLDEIKSYENKFAKAVNNFEELLNRLGEKLNSKNSTKPKSE